jgi:outer membrane protein
MKRAAALVLLVLAAAASAGAETYRFTLEEAIAYGLANSTSIRTKELAVGAAQADLAAARAALYPTLTGGAAWGHFFDPSPGAPKDAASVSADLSQTIYTFGKVGGAVRLAEQSVAQAALDLGEEKRKTVLLIRRAFYGYLLAGEVQQINRETLTRREESLEVARARFAAGLAADFEVLRAESDLESFRATVISSENGVAIALLNVKNVLGIREDDFVFELVGALEPIEAAIDRDGLVSLALQSKYDLVSLRNRQGILNAQERLSRAMNKPTFIGWASYQLSSPYDLATGKPEYLDLGAWNGNLSLGLSLSVPVSAFFPWSKETAGIRKSGLQVESLGLQLQSAESAVRLAVESTILKIAEEQAKIASGKKAVELAERLYESAQKQYEGGYISSIDLKDAELGLNAARLAHAQAIFGYNQNVVDLMDVVGVADF